MKRLQHELIVFLPSAIPSTGKTTLFERFIAAHADSTEFSVRTIKSDAIRGSLMDQQRLKDKKADQQKLLDLTQKKYKVAYEEELQKLVVGTVKLPQTKHLLFVDKNHPPDGLERATLLIREFAEKIKNLSLRFVLLVPRCETPVRAQKYDFPFSFTYLLNCIDRVLKRQNHETLEGDPIHLIQVLLMFFHMFKNQRLNAGHYLSKFGIDDFIEVKYHRETPESDSRISANIKEAIIKILDG